MLTDDGEFLFWVAANKQSLDALMDVADILIEDEFVNVKSLLNANKASDAMTEWVNGEKRTLRVLSEMLARSEVSLDDEFVEASDLCDLL